MIHPWWIFVVDAHTACVSNWNLVPTAAAVTGKVNRVRCGVGGGIPDDTYPGQEYHRKGD